METKIEDRDVTGAVRVLCSDATLAPIDKETPNVLQGKHPSALPDCNCHHLMPASMAFAKEVSTASSWDATSPVCLVIKCWGLSLSGPAGLGDWIVLSTTLTDIQSETMALQGIPECILQISLP